MVAKNPNKKLENAILEAGGGYKNVANAIGTSVRTLKRATEEGGTIKSEYLIALQIKFGVRPGSILDPAYDNYVVEGDENGEKFVNIKFYPNVQASAGHGFLAQDERSLDIAFRTYFIKNTLGASAKDLVAITAKGDSMVPDICDDDLLIIDQSKKTVESEKPYVAVKGRQVICKYISTLANERYRLISRSDVYEDEIIEANKNYFEILGEVKHIQRTL